MQKMESHLAIKSTFIGSLLQSSRYLLEVQRRMAQEHRIRGGESRASQCGSRSLSHYVVDVLDLGHCGSRIYLFR